ncbi:MAG: SDR family NAD(P)-dependent oxidoreductase [Nostoc sp. ChiQUE02]|uniref:SDR family NAD(P)-dependent oxidoreductase n=1 Tax=Nostoc sp. ChiQUE02 TaxID=3075377 RepID=UPI002AD31883|nr:SDR family NAD(P)-dependent oxidoreductase [Nostoc sp. ChiQUE02]MDZ8233544.1 SDR family NAD(P)-dependent oxidoreductase [Nostoc sp. ChiQUE02]
MSEQLQNKVAIVTGAGKGIGRAIALTFAREGAHIIIADKSPQLASQTSEAIKAIGKKAIAITTDVTQEQSVVEMVRQALEIFGTIDILVANAGIQRRYFVADLPRQEFQAMLDVNLLGTFLTCQAVLPTFYTRQQGNIILIGSDSGKRGYAYNSAYCASKFAILGFMEALADEARAYRVRVNALCLAGVKTDMGKMLQEADGTSVNDTYFMETEEVADVALFLASHQSRAIHGQAINVYGGVDYRLLREANL